MKTDLPMIMSLFSTLWSVILVVNVVVLITGIIALVVNKLSIRRILNVDTEELYKNCAGVWAILTIAMLVTGMIFIIVYTIAKSFV